MKNEVSSSIDNDINDYITNALFISPKINLLVK